MTAIAQACLSRIIPIAFGIVLLAWLYRAAFLPKAPGGDFHNHREWGGRLLDGTFLYADGANTPYPPFWAVPHAPFALLSEPLAFALYRGLGLVALTVLIRLLTRDVPSVARQMLVVFLVLLTARSFILRDLDDGGPNLIVLALAWSGMVLGLRGRAALGSACLGIAIALKCTPAIFLVYLVVKRRFRLALGTLGMALLFSLLPVLWQGPHGYLEHLQQWTAHLQMGWRAPPGWGALGPEELKNCAGRAALARQLVELPSGHPGRLDHPWRVQLLRLPSAYAGLVISGALMLLGLGVFWRLRSLHGDESIGWAAVALLMPLLSPIAWSQHCVAVIPALVFLFGEVLHRPRPRRCLGLAVIAGIYVLGMNRRLIGIDGAGVIASYGVLTVSLVMLLEMCLRLASRNLASEPPATRG